MYVLWTGIVLAAFLSGYVLGRKHRRETKQEELARTWLIRPRLKYAHHTDESLLDYPMPEEQKDPSEVVEAQWGRHELPNSGVRWS